MDPLRALKQLSATELRFRIALLEDEIALLEDAVRACRAQPESRTARLDALPDEIQCIIFVQLCNPLLPGVAVAFSSTNSELWELTQAPRQQLQADHEAAAALCLKLGDLSCKELSEAEEIWRFKLGLSATDLATLGKLTPVLPALKDLNLHLQLGSAGPDGGQLVERLGVGALPALTIFELANVCVGDAGASALAAALDRGALPRLESLDLANAAIGDAGLAALAPALRRRPALEGLFLEGNPFGDEGLAALMAPPPADAPPPQAKALVKLKWLDLRDTQITDAGCAHLVSRLRSDALPALEALHLDGISASDAAIGAVYEARAGLKRYAS